MSYRGSQRSSTYDTYAPVQVISRILKVGNNAIVGAFTIDVSKHNAYDLYASGLVFVAGTDSTANAFYVGFSLAIISEEPSGFAKG